MPWPTSIARLGLLPAWQSMAAIVCLFLLGCEKKAPTAVIPAKTTPPVAPVPAATTTASPIPAPEPPAKAPDPPPAETEKIATPEVPVPAPENTPPAPPAHRFLVITPSGPLLIDLQLFLGESPLDLAFSAMAGDLQKEIDADQDGTPTWEELLRNENFRSAAYGNVAISTPENEKEVLRRYDLNRNKQVDLEELQRFVTRNAGSGRCFSVRGDYDLLRANPRLASTWQLLQGTETTTHLSANAIAAATQRLLSRDLDTDDRLLLADLVPSRSTNAAGMPSRSNTRRRSMGTMAYLLYEGTPWDNLFVQLSDFYALGGKLHPEQFVASPAMFTYLDEDQDRRLTKAEVRRLLTSPPDALLRINFPGIPASATSSPGTTVTLLSTSEPQKSPEQASPGRACWNVPGCHLQIVIADQLASAATVAPQANALLQQFDQNRDGYLEATEVPAEQARQLPFTAIDTNKDAKVYLPEIEAYLQKRLLPQQAQVHARVELHPDSLFAWLDSREDDVLNGTETLAAPDRLKKLLRKDATDLEAELVPLVVRVVLARGDLTSPDTLFAPPAILSTPSVGGTPPWFTAMDTSGDGLISRVEFLGDPAQFQTLDTDGNQFLSPQEAVPASTANPLSN